jgi:hypothetical protein
MIALRACRMDGFEPIHRVDQGRSDHLECRPISSPLRASKSSPRYPVRALRRGESVGAGPSLTARPPPPAKWSGSTRQPRRASSSRVLMRGGSPVVFPVACAWLRTGGCLDREQRARGWIVAVGPDRLCPPRQGHGTCSARGTPQDDITKADKAPRLITSNACGASAAKHQVASRRSGDPEFSCDCK